MFLSKTFDMRRLDVKSATIILLAFLLLLLCEPYRLAAQQPQVSVTAQQSAVMVKAVFAPRYPPIAVAARVGGDVTVRVAVGADGSVARVEVVSGPKMLQQSATEAARKWKFETTDSTKADRSSVIKFSYVILPEDAVEESETEFLPPDTVVLKHRPAQYGVQSVPGTDTLAQVSAGCFVLKLYKDSTRLPSPQSVRFHSASQRWDVERTGGRFCVPQEATKEPKLDLTFRIGPEIFLLPSLAVGRYSGTWNLYFGGKEFARLHGLPKTTKASTSCMVEFEDGEPGIGLVLSPCHARESVSGGSGPGDDSGPR